MILESAAKDLAVLDRQGALASPCWTPASAIDTCLHASLYGLYRAADYAASWTGSAAAKSNWAGPVERRWRAPIVMSLGLACTVGSTALEDSTW